MHALQSPVQNSGRLEKRTTGKDFPRLQTSTACLDCFFASSWAGRGLSVQPMRKVARRKKKRPQPPLLHEIVPAHGQGCLSPRLHVHRINKRTAKGKSPKRRNDSTTLMWDACLNTQHLWMFSPSQGDAAGEPAHVPVTPRLASSRVVRTMVFSPLSTASAVQQAFQAGSPIWGDLEFMLNTRHVLLSPDVHVVNHGGKEAIQSTVSIKKMFFYSVSMFE